MKTDRTQTRRLAWVLLTVTSALLLVVGLSLLLSRSQALAQPATEIAALEVEKNANVEWVAPGDILTYTIRIEDLTGSHTTLWMTDTLPDEVTYVPGSLQHLELPGRSVGYANGVITWTASNFGYGIDTITFSVRISSETTATEIVNTAQVTGTGELLTASESTRILTGLPPNSQIRSPDKDAVITQKGSLTISGIAWDSAIEPPYLVDDPVLSVQKLGDWSYYVAWTPVASATDYALREATEPDFSDQEPIPWSGPETNIRIDKGADEGGTYYYRVQASRFGLEPSRWSNVASVVVPWTAGAPSPLASALSADEATNGPATVQVRIDQVGMADGDWHTAVVTPTDWGGWEWSHEWPLPEENDVQYTIRTRASHADGVFGPTDTITVTLHNKNYIMILPIIFSRWPPIPYAPTLYDIEEPDEDAYTVRWHYPYSDPPVSSYTLQEAKDTPTDFVDVYNGSGTSYDFSDKENGTYYYRVRGHNSYGPGEWSDVKSVTVQLFEYFDDFSDYQSGWPRLWKKTRGALYQVRPYEHPDCPGPDCTYDEGGTGYIIARRSGGTPEARFGPGVAVPSEDYEIEVDARWWDAAYFSKYQIFFGCDSSFSNYYALEVRVNIVGDSRKCEYAVVRHTTSSPSSSGIASIETTKYLQDWTYSSDMHCGLWSKSKGSKWDHWKIRREDDEIIVWVNGKRLGDWGDRTFGADRYFGVGCTLYEGFTPSKPQFDNWSVVLRP